MSPAVQELFKPPQHSSLEERNPQLRQSIVSCYWDALSKTIEPDVATVALNIGCGGSLWLETDLRLFFPKMTIVSVDIDAGVVLSARQEYPRHSVVLCDAAQPPFGKHSMDALLLNGCIGELGKDKGVILATVDALSQTLRSGGSMLIHTVSGDHAPLYKSYHTGTAWITEGLKTMPQFADISTFSTSEDFSLEMVNATKL